MNLAIIDATAREPRGRADAAASRYLTPIANAPLIAHVVSDLRREGVERVHLIASQAMGATLQRVCQQADTALDVVVTEAPAHDEPQVVLAEIERALRQGPVLVQTGDRIFPRQLGPMRERYDAGDVDAVIPRRGDAASSPEIVTGMLLLGPRTRELIRELSDAPGPLADLSETVLAHDYRAGFCAPTGQWVYSDSTEALLTANRMMLDVLQADAAPAGSGLRGRVAVSAEANLSNSVVHGPVSIAAGAVIEDCFIGPYTAIGADAVLRGTEIDNSMVLRRAQVLYPGHRIEASIIGEDCSVARSFDLPKGAHLRLAPGSQVKFS